MWYFCLVFMNLTCLQKWHLKWRSCWSRCTASKRVGFIHARQLVLHSFPQNVLENTRWVSPRNISSSLFPSLPPPSCYLLLTTLHQDLTVQKVSILWYIGTEFWSLSFSTPGGKWLGLWGQGESHWAQSPQLVETISSLQEGRKIHCLSSSSFLSRAMLHGGTIHTNGLAFFSWRRCRFWVLPDFS